MSDKMKETMEADVVRARNRMSEAVDALHAAFGADKAYRATVYAECARAYAALYTAHMDSK